jgi:hypothetical protein
MESFKGAFRAEYLDAPVVQKLGLVNPLLRDSRVVVEFTRTSRFNGDIGSFDIFSEEMAIGHGTTCRN